jgi:ATP adenylyltransferase
VTASGEPYACVFCAALEHDDAHSLVVFRGTTCYVVLNLYPYNNGHLMVVPSRHLATLASDARRAQRDDGSHAPREIA